MSEETHALDLSQPEAVENTSVQREDVVIQPKSIIAMLSEIEALKSFSIDIGEDQLNAIQTLIYLSPNTLTDTQSILVEIIKDGRINSDDIPKMIAVIQSIYQLVYSQKQLNYDMPKRTQLVKTILKLIVRLLIKEDVIHINHDAQEVFLRDTDLLIDSCVGLLQFPKSLKPKKCFQRFFK